MSETPSSPTQQPRRIRIYLAAPTADMQAERELLAGYVLPELNDRCHEMNVQLELVDVRSDPALYGASPARMAAAALRAIDECRPWFVGLMGDRCDDAPELSPELADEYPWLATRGGASLLELEMVHGALRGEGSPRPLVYVRDDRFLRDLPADEKANYSSEELTEVERLESLRGELRAADVQLVESYSCRWDADAGCITDLDELGKQLVDDLYDVILQEVEPGVAVSVFEEGIASGAAAMIGSGDGPSNGSSARQSDEDEELDFGMEDVLDISDTGHDAASSASAIEGVVPLDFLDDDEPEKYADEESASAAAEPTLDLSAAPDDPEPLTFNEEDMAEPDDLPTADAAESADEEGWSFDDVEPADDEELAEASGALPSEATVRHTEKTRVDTFAAEDAASTSGADEDDFFASLAAEEETAPPPEATSEFVPDPVQDDPVADAPAASPAVQPASLAAKPKRKKSALPAILLTTLALLLLVGGAIAGMYFAGMLPGFGDGAGGAVAGGGNDGGSGGNVPGGENGIDRAKRITDHTNKLTEIYNSIKVGGQIDGDKLAVAQAYLQQLADNEPEMLEEETIAAVQTRVAALADEHQLNVVKLAEQNRVKEFREAYASAESLQDRGLLEAASALAKTSEERQLVTALAADIDEHERLQAEALVEAAAAEQKKGEAMKAIASSVDDAEDYRQQLEAYVTAYPKDARSADFQKALEFDARTLEVVGQWNELLRAWGEEDPTQLAPAVAAQRVAAAAEGLEFAAALPGAAEVNERLPVVQAIAAREQDGKRLTDSLTAIIDSPAAKASLVFGTKDGRRYFMTAKPVPKDGNFVATYIADADGTTKEAEIERANVDPAATGQVAMADTAAAIVNELAKVDELGWETAILNAAAAVQSAQPKEGERVRPIDPVTKAQWLIALLEVGGQGSQPLAAATADVRQALSEAGVDAAFNWADPEAAAAVREKCAAALANLPPLDELKAAVDDQLKTAAQWNLTQILAPAGVLCKDAAVEGGWKVTLKNAPTWPGTSVLSLLSAENPDGPLELSPIGSTEVDVASLNEGIDPQQLGEGRVVYFVVPAPTSLPLLPLDDGPELDVSP